MIENGFRFYKMGYASAEAVVLFLIVFIITLIQIKLSNDNMFSTKKELK
jgi:multiple sugar transport system permease protein